MVIGDSYKGEILWVKSDGATVDCTRSSRSFSPIDEIRVTDGNELNIVNEYKGPNKLIITVSSDSVVNHTGIDLNMQGRLFAGSEFNFTSGGQQYHLEVKEDMSFENTENLVQAAGVVEDYY